MTVVKDIYKNGKIELTENPIFSEAVEIYVIFTEKIKKVANIGAQFKNITIDYNELENDLKQLSRNSIDHLLEEFQTIKDE